MLDRRRASSMLQSEPLCDFLRHLTSAVDAHHQWFDRINHGLVCHQEPGPGDVCENAHVNCTFGRWYATAVLPFGLPLEATERFGKIGDEHQRMHGLARSVLLASDRKAESTSTAYLEFAQSVRTLGSSINDLEGFLQARLYAVDALTGLLNRHAMYSDLENLACEIDQNGGCAVLAFVDIDFFKRVNDTYGHDAGDRVLAQVAKTLMRHTRRGDHVYRFGGEEMLVVLPECEQSLAHGMLELLRRTVADTGTAVAAEPLVAVTVSLGAATLRPNLALHSVLAAADKALYVAKGAGRNCTRWADADDIVEARL